MHHDVLNFVKESRLRGRIVDVGSFNVNGAVRDVVKIECGIDMRHGKGVDRVMTAEDMHKHFSDLDAVTCCETMEHVENWREALTSIWATIRVGGKLVFTVPHMSKGYHAHPSDHWRWSMEQIKQIFGRQKIIKDSAQLGCSFGVVVEKVSDDLDLSVEPVPVTRPAPKVKKSKHGT